LNTFFRFCNQNEYRSDNPISKIKHHKIKKSRGTAVTLSASDAESLMSFLENFDGLTDDDRNSGKQGTPGILVNYFALCLFAGIRPDWKYGEISKLRPSHLNLETGVIHVEPEVSKTNENRNVSIQPNLLEWIQRYPLETYAIIPPRFRDLRLEIRKKFDLTHDVLRHTYISMLIARDRSVGDAALNAGNTEYVIRRHYMDVVSESEAEKFWNIIPLKGSEKIIPMNQSGVAP
jgi:integrase